MKLDLLMISVRLTTLVGDCKRIFREVGSHCSLHSLGLQSSEDDPFESE
jgi:hypothetical protein